MIWVTTLCNLNFFLIWIWIGYLGIYYVLVHYEKEGMSGRINVDACLRVLKYINSQSDRNKKKASILYVPWEFHTSPGLVLTQCTYFPKCKSTPSVQFVTDPLDILVKHPVFPKNRSNRHHMHCPAHGRVQSLGMKKAWLRAVMRPPTESHGGH